MLRLGRTDFHNLSWRLHVFVIACISLSFQNVDGAISLTQSVEYLKSLALTDRGLIRDLQDFKNTVEDNSPVLKDINK